MAITVKHKFVSAIPDAGDPTIVQPSNWNDDHDLTGTIPVENGGTGASTLTGYVKGNGTAAMTASATVPSTDITGLGSMSTQNANNVAITGGSISGTTVAGYIPTTEKAQPLGVATLDAGGKVPQSQIPLMGDLNYQGTWNASTNTPTLTSSVGTKGYYYVVDVAGTTNLNGITDWQIGDWAIFNGTIWQKVDNTDAVTSVNGQVGTVVLTASSVGAVPTTRTITAGTGLTGGGDLSADRTFAIDSTVATLTGTQTLTNKTITSPKVNEILDANGNEVLGLLSTASATDYLAIKNGIGVGVPLHISSEGSSANIGLHIQPKGTGLVTISDGTDFNKGIRFRSSGSAASAITLLDAVSSAGHVVTLPDATTTLVGRGTTDTLTNKSISGTTNTLTNIGNASLTNSTITINGNSTALGGSVSVGTVTSVAATAGTGISVSGSPITGSGTLTITNTAPDQTVAIASGTGISVSGTYPNFTVTNTAPSSGGTVTSVTGTSPVVSSGGNTPAISLAASYGDTQNPYASKTANFVLAAPNGSAGAPTFRAIVAADIPTLNQNTTGTASNVTGTVAVANGGTGLTSLTANRVPYGNGTSAYQSSANLTFNGTTLTATDITDSSLTAGRVTYAGTGGNLVDTANLTWDNTNVRLGIGTATPASVAGTALVVHDSSAPRIRLTSSTTGQASTDGGEISLLATTNTLVIENRENAGTSFFNNGINTATLSAAGVFTAAGAVNAATGSTGGFYSSTFATNTSNNIWAFGNAVNYGLKYFQGTAGTPVGSSFGSNADTIALPFGQTTSGASYFQFVANGSTLGALVQPKQPKFMVGINSNTDITVNSGTYVAFNSVVYDSTSSFNTSTNRFVAPIAGKYCFSYSLFFTGSAGATYTQQAGIYVNGAFVNIPSGDAYGVCSFNATVAVGEFSCVVTLDLAIGDTVGVTARSAAIRIYQGHSNFTGYFIG